MAVEEQRSATPAAVRELAEELLTSTPALAKGMADRLHATMPELADSDDEELRDETIASCAANIDQLLRLMRLGVAADSLVVPVDAGEYVRSFVRRGIGVPGLLRSYRLGHAWLWDRWSRELQARVEDHDALAAATDWSAAFMFAYVDGISDVLVEEYGTERERMMRGAAQLRAETVRRILAGEALDEEVAAGRLGYELRRHHVALRVWSSASEVRGLERAAGETAAALGGGEPLIVPSGVASLDVWSASFDPVATDALEAYEPPADIRVAFGATGHGVAGFRRSHAEALQAARISTLAGDAAPAVTGYRRVELVSLLASDLPRARAFVAAQLGPLAEPVEPVERLRETVLAFLAAGGSGTRVAKELFVHQNTVAYRVKRAEELLGRRVTDNPVELTCALTLAVALGPAVLTEPTGPEPERD
jgi:PucR C-terminal helix-turn-helix domain/GGDEF-like domain